MRFCGGIQYSGFSNGVRYVLWGCVVGDNTGLGTHLTWTMHTSHARCDKASEWVEGPSSGAVIGDLVDAAAWGVVPCVSKIYTLRIEGYGCIRCKLWCHDVVFYF